MFKAGDKVKLKYNYNLLNVDNLCTFCSDSFSSDGSENELIVASDNGTSIKFDIPRDHHLYLGHRDCSSDSKLFELCMTIDEVIQLANKLMKEAKPKGA